MAPCAGVFDFIYIHVSVHISIPLLRTRSCVRFVSLAGLDLYVDLAGHEFKTVKLFSFFFWGFLDTLILQTYFRGDSSDISAKTATLVQGCDWRGRLLFPCMVFVTSCE